MLNENNILNEINELKGIICQTLGVKKEDIRDDSRFIEDLGADSLDIAELVLNLEDQFNVKINEEEVSKFKTIKDVIDYFNRK